MNTNRESECFLMNTYSYRVMKNNQEEQKVDEKWKSRRALNWANEICYLVYFEMSIILNDFSYTGSFFAFSTVIVFWSENMLVYFLIQIFLQVYSYSYEYTYAFKRFPTVLVLFRYSIAAAAQTRNTYKWCYWYNLWSL